MQLLRHSNNRPLSFDDSQKIGSGGEGVIYTVQGDRRLVAKVYHKPGEEQEQKLLTMFRSPPDDPMRSQGHASIAWPVDLLRAGDGKGSVVGFLMPRAVSMFSVIDLFVPKSRLDNCPLFNYQYLHRAARNICASIAALHASGYVVGDINESNILVATSALVTLVDTDSFQVREKGSRRVFRCGVGKAEFTPPELQSKSLREIDRIPEHDLFGLAVLVFQLLMEGTHPFAGQFKGSGEPPGIVQRIESGSFPFGSKPGQFAPPPIAPDFGILDPELRDLMLRCFEQGHIQPAKRPTAMEWFRALDRAENSLKSCRLNAQHRYGEHLKSCPWCARSAALGGRDYFPSLKAVKSGTHLAPPPPRQSALPALDSKVGAPPPSLPKRSHRARRTITRSRPAWIVNAAAKWEDWARLHPGWHTAACAAIGGLSLGGVRSLIAISAHSSNGWLVSLSGLTRVGHLGLCVAAGVVAVGVSAMGYWIRGVCRKP